MEGRPSESGGEGHPLTLGTSSTDDKPSENQPESPNADSLPCLQTKEEDSSQTEEGNVICPHLFRSKEDARKRFIEVTQCSEAVARRMLGAESELGKAIESFFDIKDAEGSNSSEKQLSTLSVTEEDETFFQFSSITNAPRWLAGGLLKFSRNNLDFALELFYGKQSPQTTSAFGSSALSTMYAEPEDIQYNGTLAAACNEALSKKACVIVNIQANDEFQSYALNKDVWADPVVKCLINEASALFFQTDVESRDTRIYRSLFSDSSNVPHIAIVNPLRGERRKLWEAPEILDKISLQHALVDLLP